jgi:hypothetical protein
MCGLETPLPILAPDAREEYVKHTWWGGLIGNGKGGTKVIGRSW